MRASRMLCIAVALIAAASVVSAVTWSAKRDVSGSEPQNGDFQVPMNNAWGAQSYDYYHGWFSPANEERVHVTYWFLSDSNYFEVRYAKSENRGGSFPVEDRHYISDIGDEDEAWTPSIATFGPHTDTHDVNIAYYDEQEVSEDQRYSILRARSDDQGKTWPSGRGQVTPNSWEDDCFRPSAATCRSHNGTANQYRLHVVWEDEDDATYTRIQYWNRRITQGDNNTSGPYTREELTSGNVEVFNPSIAAHYKSSDTVAVYVVWFDDSTGTDEVWFRRSLDDGNNWDAKVNISGTASYESQAPCVATNDNHVYVVWQEETYDAGGNYFQVRFKHSDDYGETWGSSVSITDDLMDELDHNRAPECFAPSIACYEDNVYVVCQAGWDSPTEWYTVGFMMSDDNGANWSSEGVNSGGTDEPPDLDDGSAGLFPTISVSKGDGQTMYKYLNVLYRAYDDSNDYQVYYLSASGITTLPGDGDGGQACGRTLVRHLKVHPSPVRTAAHIDLDIVSQGLVDLSVYDVQGRRVTCLGKGILPVGPYRTTWNGTDQAGNRASAGTYLVVLKTESETLTRPLQLLGR